MTSPMLQPSLFPLDEPDALYFRSLSSGSCGNASLLRCGEVTLMIDAGLGIRALKKHFKELGPDPHRLSAVLVTHDHADHIRGLEAFAVDYSVPVYSSPQVYRAFHHADYLHGGLLNYLISMPVGEAMTIGPLEITSLEVPHDATQNVGYRIKGPSGTLTFLTDVGEVTPQMEQAIRESNYLVIESNYDEEMLRRGPYPHLLKQRILGGQGHLSNAESARTVVRNLHPGLKFVALCHLSGHNNSPTVAYDTMATALRRAGVAVGTDLRLEVLGRRVVSEEFRLSL